MTMSCQAVRDRLDDYVDGEVSEAELQEIELHLETCAGCREEERVLRRLLGQAAALPRVVLPARDLWPEVAAGIEKAPARRLPALAWGAGLLAAALATVAVWLGPAREAAPPPPVTASSGPAVEAPTTDAEREYRQAAEALNAALRDRRTSLSPETLAGLDQNLRSIDAALAEIHQALAQDPKSASLNRLLSSTHEKKVETLRRVLRLASL